MEQGAQPLQGPEGGEVQLHYSKFVVTGVHRVAVTSELLGAEVGAIIHALGSLCDTTLVTVESGPPYEEVLAPGTLPSLAGLTPRQQTIGQFLAQGLNPTQIAEQLHVREDTVRDHIESIMQKLGAQDRAAVAAKLATMITLDRESRKR